MKNFTEKISIFYNEKFYRKNCYIINQNHRGGKNKTRFCKFNKTANKKI